MKSGKGFRKVVQRVTVIDSERNVHTIYRKKRSKERHSPMVRPIEAAARRVAQGVSAGVETYLDEHDEANREARDGWLQSAGPNLFKASRKALAKLTRTR